MYAFGFAKVPQGKVCFHLIFPTFGDTHEKMIIRIAPSLFLSAQNVIEPFFHRFGAENTDNHDNITS
jgi:hypothetical protein